VQSPAESEFLKVAVPVGRRQKGETDFAWNRRQHLVGRMTVLEDMGIARSTGTGTWSVRSDMEAVLRAMQRAGDRQKTLAAHGVPLSDERLQIEVFDFERTDAVEGRVLVHGEEEQSGRRYLILEGVDARAHFIQYTPEMEEARANGSLRTNSFTRLRRVLLDGQPVIEIENFGDSEALLKRSDHFGKKAQELLQRGIDPRENGWGGWLGRYQRALSEAAENVEFQQKTRHEDRMRQRSWDR
jgi:hypothetical protein